MLRYVLNIQNWLFQRGAGNHTLNCIEVGVNIHLCYFALVDVYDVYHMQMAVQNLTKADRRITIKAIT